MVAGLVMSLDGVAEAPEQWGFQYVTDETYEVIGAGLAQADAVLLGRRTYREFAELYSRRARPMSARTTMTAQANAR